MCGFPTSCLEIQLLALVGLDVMVLRDTNCEDSLHDVFVQMVVVVWTPNLQIMTIYYCY